MIHTDSEVHTRNWMVHKSLITIKKFKNMQLYCNQFINIMKHPRKASKPFGSSVETKIPGLRIEKLWKDVSESEQVLNNVQINKKI